MKQSVGLSDLPQFTIASIEQAGDGYLLRGQLTIHELVHSGRAWLRTAGGIAVYGNLISVSPTGNGSFATSDDAAERLEIGTSLPLIHGFWDPQQVVAILDPHRLWKKVLFKPRAAVQSSIPGWRVLTDSAKADPPDQSLVDAAWDHEHCLVCSATISNGSPGFVDGEHNWLCPTCHQAYAIHHDLHFLMPSSRRPDA